MRKYKSKLLKILKWTAVVILGYWCLTTLIFGYTDLNTKTGVQGFGWSGFKALFSDEEFGFFIDEQWKTNLKGVDGPYIFDDSKFWVNEESKLVNEKFDRRKPINVFVDNNDKDTFEIILKNSYQNEPEHYNLPTKLIAISDIEGNFNALQSFLINNKVIDKDLNWIFEEGHLVFNGDFFDRGENVTQVLWLIYSLEKKAEEQNGKVHFINGNHEIMNLHGDISHSDHRYIEVAKQISNIKHWDKASKFLYSKNSELGKWLRTKNVIEKIGNYIFVHGGLNIEHVEEELSINEINKTAKKYYGSRIAKDNKNVKERLIVGTSKSPYWDRSLAMNFMYKMAFFLDNSSTPETTESELNEILTFYNAEKIVIGHSVVNNVLTDYNGKVIKIDVKHSTKKNSSKTQGFFIENGAEYRVNGIGDKVKL